VVAGVEVLVVVVVEEQATRAMDKIATTKQAKQYQAKCLRDIFIE
jgi:hypothetical protein